MLYRTPSSVQRTDTGSAPHTGLTSAADMVRSARSTVSRCLKTQQCVERAFNLMQTMFWSKIGRPARLAVENRAFVPASRGVASVGDNGHDQLKNTAQLALA